MADTNRELKLVSWNVNGLRAVMKKGFEDIVSEIDPDNNAVVMISASEVYRINHVHPKDIWTRKAEVSELDAADLSAYGAPA